MGMVRCMVADNGLPMFVWGADLQDNICGDQGAIFRAQYAIPIQNAKGDGDRLRILRVIGARAFVHIERRTKKLPLKAVEGKMVGYSSNSNSYRVYNPVIQFIMESRNVIFIETLSRLLPPPLEKSQLLMQERPPEDNPGRDNKDHNYITNDYFLRDLRNYTSVVDHPGNASTDHVPASRHSENTLMAELLGKMSGITRRDL